MSVISNKREKFFPGAIRFLAVLEMTRDYKIPMKTFINYIFILQSIYLLMACSVQSPHLGGQELLVNDQVIANDTIWQGDVFVQGVVLVSREATLSIKPGTFIRFKKDDRNGDGIGDAEIRVLGRLLALGTEDKPIRFESAEKIPAPKDWSYVLIFSSGKKSTLQYCEFRHAFSGLQVHFSTAKLFDSLFINNYEGIRFGRAQLQISHNTFTDNDTAIRFTRMEGPVTINNNEISGNRQGIFLVPSGQNITDFFEPDRSGRPWNTGRLQIFSNNIYNNRDYNLNLGEKQFWNLDVTNNWWGSLTESSIEEKIFDRKNDGALGKALYHPFSKSSIKEAGVR